MAEPVTISNTQPAHPGMDYAFLRQEGIKLIEKLASTHWSDYNAHDPGITILEAWCYALTDLSYRLNFEIEDLLAFPTSESDRPPLFLSARESLTTQPLTINDYRKLLIDIDGINNAWLEPIANPHPPIYYDAQNAKLTFSNLDSSNIAQAVHLRGLYRVLIEKSNHTNRTDPDILRAAKEKLNQNRNLCEDFDEITILQPEPITVHANLEISDHVDPHQLIAQIYTALEQVVSPTINVLNLHDLLESGVPTEDIFAGPQLDHGFIDDAQLQQCKRKTELHTSDLIHVILNIDAVKTVRHITLSSAFIPPQDWDLNLTPQLTPRLKPIDAIVEDITLHKGKIVCPISGAQAKTALNKLNTAHRQLSSTYTDRDLPIPTGNYRELANYESLQSEFPLAYGIGEAGLTSTAPPQRKAQAKQLQAYLMVFDQLLANYFAQLDHVRHLFAWSNAQAQSYFTQSIAHFPGAKEILQDRYLETFKEEPAVARDRKNRFLEHLMAQYGESFIDYSLLYGNPTIPAEAIQHKSDFARDYRAISAGRAQAFNYSLHPSQSNNVSGLKRRVSRLLGINPNRRSLTVTEKSSDRNLEGFYVIEHLLLRPRLNLSSNKEQSKEASTNPAPRKDLLSFSKPIKAISTATPETITCISDNHGLKPKDKINILYSSHYNGTYTVLNTQENTFDIKANFITDHVLEQDAWVKQNQSPDPFSFQISLVLPNWPLRFSSDNFKQLIYSTLIAEIPAHITVFLHWLDPSTMKKLEVIHDLWLQHLSKTVTDNPDSRAAAKAASTQLIDFLKLGSTEIPEIPALLGYMAINDPDEEGLGPHFVVYEDRELSKKE